MKKLLTSMDIRSNGYPEDSQKLWSFRRHIHIYKTCLGGGMRGCAGIAGKALRPKETVRRAQERAQQFFFIQVYVNKCENANGCKLWLLGNFTKW